MARHKCKGHASLSNPNNLQNYESDKTCGLNTWSRTTVIHIADYNKKYQTEQSLRCTEQPVQRKRMERAVTQMTHSETPIAGYTLDLAWTGHSERWAKQAFTEVTVATQGTAWQINSQTGLQCQLAGSRGHCNEPFHKSCAIPRL